MSSKNKKNIFILKNLKGDQCLCHECHETPQKTSDLFQLGATNQI